MRFFHFHSFHSDRQVSYRLPPIFHFFPSNNATNNWDLKMNHWRVEWVRIATTVNQHLACVLFPCVFGVGAKPGDFNEFNIKIHPNQSGTNIVALIADVFVAWKIVTRPAVEVAEQMHERKEKNCWNGIFLIVVKCTTPSWVVEYYCVCIQWMCFVLLFASMVWLWFVIVIFTEQNSLGRVWALSKVVLAMTHSSGHHFCFRQTKSIELSVLVNLWRKVSIKCGLQLLQILLDDWIVIRHLRIESLTNCLNLKFEYRAHCTMYIPKIPESQSTRSLVQSTFIPFIHFVVIEEALALRRTRVSIFTQKHCNENSLKVLCECVVLKGGRVHSRLNSNLFDDAYRPKETKNARACTRTEKHYVARGDGRVRARVRAFPSSKSSN